MPLPLIPVEAIINITIVDILNFQPVICTTLGFTGNFKLFKNLAIAKCRQYLSPFDKLNAHTKIKTEYYSFLKHPFRQIFTNTLKTSTKMTDSDYPKPTVTAAMTASEQQTGVFNRRNE